MSTPFVSTYLKVAADDSDRPTNPVEDDDFDTSPEMIAFRFEADTQTLIFWDPVNEDYLTVQLGGPGVIDAADVSFDNAASGLAATNVQDAIDELDATVDGLGSPPATTDDLPEGSNLYFTAERAQDEVGNILADSTDIDLTYNDGVPSITASFKPNATTYAAAVMVNSPTGYWKLDEASGNIADSSGNGFTMTASGTPNYQASPLFPWDDTKYVHFDGNSTDGFTITSVLGTSPPLTGDYTIECIVMPLDFSTTIKIFSIGGAGTETAVLNFQTELRISTGGAISQFWEQGAGTDESTSTGIVIVEAAVYHIAQVKDGTANTLTTYVNGRKVATTTYTNEPTGGTDAAMTSRIGYDALSNSGEQVLGHVAFYNGVKLTAAQIRTHARAAGLTM